MFSGASIHHRQVTPARTNEFVKLLCEDLPRRPRTLPQTRQPRRRLKERTTPAGAGVVVGAAEFIAPLLSSELRWQCEEHADCLNHHQDICRNDPRPCNSHVRLEPFNRQRYNSTGNWSTDDDNQRYRTRRKQKIHAALLM